MEPDQEEIPLRIKKQPINATRKKPKPPKMLDRKFDNLKIIDYELPLIRSKGRSLAVREPRSMTIEPPVGRLIRNTSNHKLSDDHYSTIVPSLNKFKLSGKKYDPLPTERPNNRWLYEEASRSQYNSNTTSLLFTKSK